MPNIIHSIKSIWFSPKTTIHRLNNGREHGVLVITLLYGVIVAAMQVSEKLASAHGAVVVIAMLVGVFIGGPVRAVLSLYIISWLFRWTGSWLGGNANNGAVRTAVAWSNVPIIAGCLFAIVLSVIDSSNNSRDSATVGLMIAELWGYFILASGLMAVQQMGLFKVLLSMLFVFPIWLVVMFLLGSDDAIVQGIFGGNIVGGINILISAW